MVDRNPAHQRSSWPLLVGLGLVGLVTGALAGYFGYSFAVVAKNPLVSVADDSGEQPFDQTYREMARLAGLEIVAGKCDSAPIEHSSRSRRLSRFCRSARDGVPSEGGMERYVVRSLREYRARSGRLPTAQRCPEGEATMTRGLKLGFVLVVGLIAGISVGVLYARQTIGTSSNWMSQWAAVGTYAELTNLQYQYADEAHARAALSDFVKFAEQLRAKGTISDPKTFGFDVALAYMRLAMLDRRAGNMDGYQANLSSAQDALKAAGSEHTSADEMERFVSQHEPHR